MKNPVAIPGDAEEHEDVEDCTAKADDVVSDGPRACHFQNLVATFVADIKFERIGHIRKTRAAVARFTSASIRRIADSDILGCSFGITIVNLIDAHGRQHKVEYCPKQAKEHQNIKSTFLAQKVEQKTVTKASAAF